MFPWDAKVYPYASKQALGVYATFRDKVKKNGKVVKLDFIVLSVENMKSLMGYRAAVQLGYTQKVNAMPFVQRNVFRVEIPVLPIQNPVLPVQNPMLQIQNHQIKMLKVIQTDAGPMVQKQNLNSGYIQVQHPVSKDCAESIHSYLKALVNLKALNKVTYWWVSISSCTAWQKSWGELDKEENNVIIETIYGPTQGEPSGQF